MYNNSNDSLKQEHLFKSQARQNQHLIAQIAEMQSIINNITDGIVLYDETGKILMHNNEAMEYINLTNQTFDQVLPDKPCVCRDMFGRQMDYEHMPVSIALNGELVLQKRLLFERDAEKVYLDISATPMLRKGKLERVVLTIRNVTKNVTYHELLHAQQKIMLDTEKSVLKDILKSKDDFVMMISHEFKTPITVINSAVQAMELMPAGELSNKAKSHLEKIRRNSQRQMRLTENLLAITKISTGNEKLNLCLVEIMSITRSILDSVNVYASMKNIRLIVEMENEPRLIYIDYEKYERILLNLLSNAIKFTSPDKNVFVHLSCVDMLLVLEVGDEGIGIPENARNLIFEKFGQVHSTLSRHAEGTGLGLFLVKSLVELLGGVISLTSFDGKGSIFRIEIPVTQQTLLMSKSEFLPKDFFRLEDAASIEFSDIYFPNSNNEVKEIKENAK